MLYGAPGWWHTTQALTQSIGSLSAANGPIWSQVTKAAFQRAWRRPKWYFRPLAFQIAAYMHVFRAAKSVIAPSDSKLKSRRAFEWNCAWVAIYKKDSLLMENRLSRGMELGSCMPAAAALSSPSMRRALS